MRSRKWSTVVALVALMMWNMPHLVLAHGGGGGGGGGHGGGGGFGGGHGGGFGGGHMGGGHIGGFGGGHIGGFGGHYGGYGGGLSGGHYGGFGGLGGGHSAFGSSPAGGIGHSGIGSSGIGHSGIGSSGIGSSGIGHSGIGSSGIGHSGALGGLSGVGGHHATSNLGSVQHNPNSFTTRHVAGQNLSNGATGNRVLSGYRGAGGASYAGTHAQGLLSHQASGLGQHSNFLQHHGVSPVGTGVGGHGLPGSGTAMGQHHHGGMNGQGFHHGGMNGHGFRNQRGFYPFFGFGFPFFGFGYPFFGLGYGLGYGYGGYGYGGYGYGGYGYGGYGGYGYGYNPYAYYSGPYGYGYGAYAYPYSNAQVAPAQPATTATDAEVFAQKGENDFKTADYKSAVYSWRHALVDDPQNGVLTLMLAQGLFATGSFDEAAGAVQQAMQLLPEDQWGVVVSNYRELYGKIGDYTTQLRALEKAVKQAPDDPGLRFLLGYHYGYLGYPAQAVKQLDKTLELAPADQMAQKLRDQFKAKLPKAADANDKEAGGGQPKGQQADDKLTAEGQAGLPQGS